MTSGVVNADGLGGWYNRALTLHRVSIPISLLSGATEIYLAQQTYCVGLYFCQRSATLGSPLTKVIRFGYRQLSCTTAILRIFA
jgi:hypothetical protein